jgi:hypothetical protein
VPQPPAAALKHDRLRTANIIGAKCSSSNGVLRGGHRTGHRCQMTGPAPTVHCAAATGGHRRSGRDRAATASVRPPCGVRRAACDSPTALRQCDLDGVTDRPVTPVSPVTTPVRRPLRPCDTLRPS